MASGLKRALTIIESLAAHPSGADLDQIAGALKISRNSVARIVSELAESGYVRQLDLRDPRYVLTTQLAALAFAYLAQSGILDIAQPILDGLAQRTGELIRLAIADGDKLRWIAKAQGARFGLRYDPEMGRDTMLSSAATRFVWLASFPAQKVHLLVQKQALEDTEGRDETEPLALDDMLARVEQARTDGYSLSVDGSEPDIATVAVAIAPAPGGAPIGVIALTGPRSRLTEPTLKAIVPELKTASRALARSRHGSPALQGAVLPAFSDAEY